MSKPSWLIALENKWIKDGKDTSPVLSEFGFTKFWNEHAYPYLNGSAHTGFTPVGTVIAYFGETAPQNYLICDGSQYNKADYPELWTLLSSLTDTTPYVVDGDNTKFKVPDLRGEFLRGTGANSHTNQGSGGDVGVHQDATEHFDIYNLGPTAGTFGYVPGSNNQTIYSRKNADGIVDGSTGAVSAREITISSRNTTNGTFGTLSRPTNTSVLYCIAYKNIYIDAVIGQSTTEITNPQDGQGLVYNATNDKWVNGEVAGGLHEYSTTEQVVGTWIDGRPIYEKVIELSKSQLSSGQQEYLHNITSVDEGWINVSGSYLIWHPTAGKSCWSLCSWNGNTNMNFCVMASWVSSTKFSITIGPNILNNMESTDKMYVCINYTKTTDTPTVQS